MKLLKKSFSCFGVIHLYFWASPVAQQQRIRLWCRRWQETCVRSMDREEPLAEGMTTHSRILDWRISWSEEPGGLQSIGLQRVGPDWRDWTRMHASLLSLKLYFWWNKNFTFSYDRLLQHLVSLTLGICLKSVRYLIFWFPAFISWIIWCDFFMETDFFLWGVKT